MADQRDREGAAEREEILEELEENHERSRREAAQGGRKTAAHDDGFCDVTEVRLGGSGGRSSRAISRKTQGPPGVCDGEGDGRRLIDVRRNRKANVGRSRDGFASMAGGGVSRRSRPQCCCRATTAAVIVTRTAMVPNSLVLITVPSPGVAPLGRIVRFQRCIIRSEVGNRKPRPLGTVLAI